MGRKDKGRRYAARGTYGAKVTHQPSPGKREYSYVLVCSGCDWESNERHGSIDLNASNAGLMGRFDCEACRKSNTFAIQEAHEAQPNW